LKKYLFFFFVLFVIIGIVLEDYFKFSAFFIFVVLLVLIAFLLSAFLIKIPSPAYLILFFLNAIAIGMFAHNKSLVLRAVYPFNVKEIKKVKVFGKVEKIFLISKNKIIIVEQTDSIRINNKIIKKNILLLTNIYGSKYYLNRLYEKLNIGDILIATGNISIPPTAENPGEFDFRKFLLNKNIIAIFNVYYSNKVLCLHTNKFNFNNLIFKIRKSLDESIHTLNRPITARLLRALLLADKSELSYDIKLDFINSGVVHVLAVSGLHVGYILLIFLFLFNRFNLRLRYFFTVIGLLFFMVVTGMPASVVRATLMAVFSIAALILNRNYNLLNSIAFAALVIVMYNSNQLFQPGFQLSFAAVLSIIIFGKMFSGKINKLNVSKSVKNLMLFFSVTLAAQLGTFPFILIYFHKISLVSFLLNLIVIPLVGIILGVGIISLAVSLVSFYFASIFATVNYVLTLILLGLVKFSSKLPFAFVRVPDFTTLFALIYSALLILLTLIITRLRKKKTKIIFVAILLFVFVLQIKYSFTENIPQGEYTLFFTKIKNDFYSLARLPDGKNILIYSYIPSKGKHMFNYRIVQILNNLGIDKINYLILNCPVKRFNEYSYYLTNNLITDSLVVPFKYSYIPSLLKNAIRINGIKRMADHLIIKSEIGDALVNVNTDEITFAIGKISLTYLNLIKANREQKKIIKGSAAIITTDVPFKFNNLKLNDGLQLLIIQYAKNRTWQAKRTLVNLIKNKYRLNKALLFYLEQNKIYLVNWCKDFSKIEIK